MNTHTDTAANPTTDQLRPPAFLRGRAREIWDELLPEVEALGVAVGIEAAALGCLCTSIADLEECERSIAELGLFHRTERGIAKHPGTAVKNQALANIAKFSTAFGLTPASRSRTLHARRQNQHPHRP